jgi:hypothetical protein
MSSTRRGLSEFREKEVDKIRDKWDFLLQGRPDMRSMVGNSKLIGGRISHHTNHEMIFEFITKKDIFSYNEAAHEFKTKLEIR